MENPGGFLIVQNLPFYAHSPVERKYLQINAFFVFSTFLSPTASSSKKEKFMLFL